MPITPLGGCFGILEYNFSVKIPGVRAGGNEDVCAEPTRMSTGIPERMSAGQLFGISARIFSRYLS